MKLTLQELAGNAKNLLDATAVSAAKKIWRAPLSQPESFARLREFVVSEAQHPDVHLPDLAAANGGGARHRAETRSFAPDCVWQVRPGHSGIKTVSVCRMGGLLLNRRWLPDLDLGAKAGLLDSPLKPRRMHHPLVVAPWSHRWASYYDYTTFVVAKLCRIELALGPDIWREAQVCYPLRHTAFERDFLRELGIPEANVIDTATLWGTELQTECAVVGNCQPSWSASLGDLALLRARFGRPRTADEAPASRRLYIARRGRRRVLNEEPVRQLLLAHGFEMIEDEPRSIAEQVALFREAAVVVAPHGAALTNLLWSAPGTQVLEFCNAGYAPNYFYYLCTALGLDYQFLADYSSGPANNHWAHMERDIVVPLPALAQQLGRMLHRAARPLAPAPAAGGLSW